MIDAMNLRVPRPKRSTRVISCVDRETGKDETYLSEESKIPGPVDDKIISYKYERTKQKRETNQGSDSPVKASSSPTTNR